VCSSCGMLHARAPSPFEQVGFKDSIFAQNLPADKAACYFHRSAPLCSCSIPQCPPSLPPSLPFPPHATLLTLTPLSLQ
jgi:hypothetical protein